MIYKVLFTYHDDKTVSILMDEERVDLFLDDVGRGKVHRNPETNVGFWTSYEQIRHIIIQPVGEKKDGEQPEDGDKVSDSGCGEGLQEGVDDSQTKDTSM